MTQNPSDPIAYMIREGEHDYLCVLDHGEFRKILMKPIALQRLAREAVNAAIPQRKVK